MRCGQKSGRRRPQLMLIVGIILTRSSGGSNAARRVNVLKPILKKFGAPHLILRTTQPNQRLSAWLVCHLRAYVRPPVRAWRACGRGICCHRTAWGIHLCQVRCHGHVASRDALLFTVRRQLCRRVSKKYRSRPHFHLFDSNKSLCSSL